jgi:hypothetical protein
MMIFRFINKQSLKEFKAFPDHIQKRFTLDLTAVCRKDLEGVDGATRILDRR